MTQYLDPLRASILQEIKGAEDEVRTAKTEHNSLAREVRELDQKVNSVIKENRRKARKKDEVEKSLTKTNKNVAQLRQEVDMLHAHVSSDTSTAISAGLAEASVLADRHARKIQLQNSR
ncbi:hypothetical protein Slin14017_G091100 [Septoria linicola]|nr:hypothetical protein Slin14017_G091100 [Septoria linicola]